MFQPSTSSSPTVLAKVPEDLESASGPSASNSPHPIMKSIDQWIYYLVWTTVIRCVTIPILAVWLVVTLLAVAVLTPFAIPFAVRSWIKYGDGRAIPTFLNYLPMITSCNNLVLIILIPQTMYENQDNKESERHGQNAEYYDYGH